MDSEFFIVSRKQDVRLALTQEQFKELKRARKRLSSAYAISHKHRLVLSNYELILEAMRALGEQYVRQENIQAIENGKARLNANINNYVLSARIFTSQLKRHVQGCVPQDRDLVNVLSRKMESEYKRSFAYRFIDSLYDYVAHYGLSIHTIKITSEMKPNDVQQYERHFFVNAYIEKDYIGGPAEFRASVFNEVSGTLDLIDMLTSFNESLTRLHDQAMDLVRPVFVKANELVNEFISVFVSEHGNKHANLFVVHGTPMANDKVYDKFPISMYVNNHNFGKEYV
ncbi:hypothetical protein OPS25_09665 [Alteromonas ponticola]|uniref:Uncharacterized protein n=1 Tax=Alteromonas aquimaris TaxID=2998417 RepID=A0ABT3P7L7_9ALTE|nr:hypothetical protein [Alteromonas aquimaris]MCW8108760.1 hypothetical protein [Alteromonas aquimaris]